MTMPIEQPAPGPGPEPVNTARAAPVPYAPDGAPPGEDGHDPAEAPFLGLLATGAAAEEYERPVLRARAGGASAGRLAALERAKLRALRVRAELEDRRRREAELSALYATAHDLAGLRDLDAVLRAIVRRARSLLGTEVAYLTLHDPSAGDTYVRVTCGSVSARLQQLRLGMGEGLGGLVAQTARPYVTDSYFHDERFRHTRSIDSGVQDEGLVAILGVPLMLGSGVIGVLFAADRRERVFEHGQIALLAAHAAHAAVAIDTANLLAETRKTLTELEAANEIIRDRSAVIERASDIHDRLTELVLRGGGVQDVAGAVAEVLDGEVEFAEPGAAPAEALDRSRADGHAVRDGADWVAAVGAGGEVLGALVLRGHPALDPVDQRTLERAAMVTSLLLLARRTAGEAEQRVRGELLDDLLNAADRDPRLLRERAARVGADLDVPHIVLAARTDGPEGGDDDAHSHGADRRRLWSAASHLAATRRGLAALTVPGGAAGAGPDRPGRGRRRLRLPRPAARRHPRCARLRPPHARRGHRLRRPSRYGTAAHPRRLLRLRDEPGPHQGGAAPACQHRGAAPGPGEPAAGTRLADPGARPGDPAGAAAASALLSRGGRYRCVAGSEDPRRAAKRSVPMAASGCAPSRPAAAWCRSFPPPTEECEMADKGAMDKMKGKAKQKAGKIMGDERLKGEGRADEAKGRAKGAMSDAKENARGMKDSMKGRDRS